MRELPKVIGKLSRIEFRGREYLFRAINLYGPEDLVQEFWLRCIQGRASKDEKLIVYDFFEFVKRCVARAKKRLAITYQNAFSSYFNENDDSLFSYLEGRRKK